MQKIFQLCKEYLLRHKISVSIYIVICIMTSLFSLVSPYISGSFIDSLISIKNINSLMNYCYIFVALSIGSIVFNFLSNRIYTKLQADIGYEINEDIIKHIQKLSLSYIEKKDTAYLTQRISTDSSIVISFSLSIIQNISINILMFIFPLFMLLSFNMYIALVMIILIFIYLLAYKLFKKPIFKIGYVLKEKQAIFFNRLYEQLSYIKFIKLHGIINWFQLKLKNSYNEMLKFTMKYQKINYLFSSLDNMIMVLAQITLFILGGNQVIQGKLSIGQFAIISTYFTMMMGAIRYFFGLGKTIQEIKISYNRLMDIINVQQEATGVQELEKVSTIHINHVSFSYGEKLIFKQFTTKFQKGKIYTLIGPNGSGKSTLINLLLGMYIDEFEGEILYDGVSIKNLNMQNIRQKIIAISEQEPLLIEDSIQYNLSLDNSDQLDMNNLYSLISMLGAENFFKSLTNGMNTIINEKSCNLSSGEKQKISLLRAFLKNSDVILLDEPTSALDVESRSHLIDYLFSIKHEKIIIISTHDELFSKICDEQIMLTNNMMLSC